jgi:hypothetical protein
MRQNIMRLTLFVGLLMVLDRLVYAGAMYMRDHGGHPQGIDVIYQDESWSPQIIFLGDSRTKRNFDMQVVESLTGLSAYDFGYDNSSAEEALYILEQFLIHKHNPRVVVFEADPPMLDEAYGVFHREHFRTHVAVVPEPADLLRPNAPTMPQRASAFALTWLMKSASLPNRLPDLLELWQQRDDDTTTKVQVLPCGPEEMHLRCRSYNGASTFVEGHSDKMTWRVLPFGISAERKKLYEYVAELAEKNDFSLILLQTPRLNGDQAYPAELKAGADTFFCGLARNRPNVLYARLTHAGGIDLDSSLYWDWEHFNGVGAVKISQMIAPLITAMAAGARPESCVLD